LTTGSAGRLQGKEFRIQTQTLVEIALVGRRFERHEYYLTAGDGDKALLVCGSAPGARGWILFTPLHPASAVTPQQAATVRRGQTVNVEGALALVSDLFQSTVRQVESPEADGRKPGDVLYCFAGASDRGEVLARWDASRIEFFQGQTVSEKEVTAAFKPQSH
jgi:hypothetical protein